MSKETDSVGPSETRGSSQAQAPAVVDRPAFQADLDALRAREKAHTRQGDAIAAARRTLPMVEVDPTVEVIGYAIFCQGPYEETVRYRDFMGWDVPWYSVQDSAEALLAGRQVNRFYLVCYLRDGDRVFETYWTNGRGVEPMGNGYTLLDLTVYGRQESWEDSPAGWPQPWGPGKNPYRTDAAGRPTDGGRGRPIAQWSRLEAGRSDELGTAVA